MKSMETKICKNVGKKNLLQSFKSIKDTRMDIILVARSAEIYIIKATIEQLGKKTDRRKETWQCILQERFFLN